MNETTGRVLELLKGKDGYLSGEQIGHGLAISRSAVWKHVRELKRAGYGIVSSPKKGYSLRTVVNAPLAAEVTPHLKTLTLGRHIEYHETVDSTNRAAAELARQGAAEGTVVVADAQTAGRGRMGRRWLSPAGGNLYFSVLLTPNVEPARVPQLALVAAVAVHEGLAECCPEIPAQIKWPNDILIARASPATKNGGTCVSKNGGTGVSACQKLAGTEACPTQGTFSRMKQIPRRNTHEAGRKVAGILCEASLEADRVHRVILGVGINVNGTSVPRELGATATTLRRAGGRDVSRPALLAAVLNHLEARYGSWLQDRSLSGLLAYFERHSALNGKPVVAENLSGMVRGTARGITPTGELVIETAGGERIHLQAGDVHLLPLDGAGDVPACSADEGDQKIFEIT